MHGKIKVNLATDMVCLQIPNRTSHREWLGNREAWYNMMYLGQVFPALAKFPAIVVEWRPPMSDTDVGVEKHGEGLARGLETPPRRKRAASDWPVRRRREMVGETGITAFLGVRPNKASKPNILPSHCVISSYPLPITSSPILKVCRTASGR